MRLVCERIATVEEINRSWTVRKVFEYNEFLDLREEADLAAAEARHEASEAARFGVT